MPIPRDLVQQSMLLPLAMMLGQNVTNVTNETTLIAAIAAGSNIVIYEPITLTANRTIVGSLTIAKGGLVTTAGFTLTINSHFVAGPYQVFTAASGEVVFGPESVDQVLPEWWGAVNDGTTACTDAINKAIASTRGIVFLRAGTYSVTGLTITNSLTIQGDGWKTIVKNTSATNHTFSRTGSANQETRAIKIADLALTFTGGGSSVDGIHLEEVNNHTRLERLYILSAPRHGVYLSGDEPSYTGSLYTRLDQVWSTGNGTDGCFLDGAINNATIIGGRFGGNGRYGLNVDDSITGDPAAFPNTLRVFGTDLPGNNYGLHEAGHSNCYYGIRFEGNTTADILFASKSSSAMFYGTSYSSTPVISGTPTTRATMYDKDFSVRQFEDYGYLEYYDEGLAAIRKAPKRSVYNININSTLALSGTVDWPVARLQDRLKIKRVSIIPATTITGANTNYMKLTLRVSKTGGGDAAIASTTFTNGVNATLLTDNALTISGEDSRVDGDVIYFEKTEFGTGMATPNLTVQVEYGGY